jgi:predicted PurR-regulated permease PerM
VLKQNNFIIILFIISLFGIYVLYHPFLDSIMIAVLLGIATSSLYVGIHQYVKSKLAISIIATTVFIIFFFGPIGYFITNIAIYINSIESGTFTQTIEFARAWVMDLPPEYEWLKTLLIETFQEFDFKALSNQALQLSSSFGSVSAKFVKDLMLITVFYAIFMYYGEVIGGFVSSILPMSKENITSIYTRVSSTMSVVLYSILATAIFEGFLFSLIAIYLGYNGILFGILYGFASLIPVIGGAIMWLPIFFYELSKGNEANAYIVAIYSVVVISIVADTFIKPLIIDRINKTLAHSSETLNALIIFFSILAGLSSFGFWGMIIGPALTSLFFAVVKITNEMQSKESM